MYVGGVEGLQRRTEVAGEAGAHREGVRVPYEQREQTARRQHPGQPGQHRVGLLDVHQDAVAEHHVEAAGQEVHTGLPAVALDQLDPLPDALGLGRQGFAGRPQQLGVRLQTGHRVTGPRETQRLDAPAHTDVQDAQPLTDREPPGYLLVQLPGHELLADGVPSA